MVNDPYETKNLAQVPSCAGSIERLRRELVRRRDELGDTCEMGQTFWGCYEKNTEA